MKNILFALILFFPFLESKAQKEIRDFLVTQQKDTIYGKITNLQNVFAVEKFKFGGARKQGIDLQVNNNQSMFFYPEDLFSFRFREHTYRVINYNNKKGEKVYFYLCMLIDGKQKLGIIGCDFESTPWMVYKGKFLNINPKNFSQTVWQEMMECSSFAEIHKNISDKKVKNLLRTNRYNELILIINKYNSMCN